MMDSKNDVGLLLLRLTFGGLMLINHGWGKFQMIMNGVPSQFPDPLGLGGAASLYLAVFAEVICAALIVVGAFTRYAVVPLIITMLIAALIVHGDDPFKKMEGAILFLIPYVILLIQGAGDYSVDSRLRNV